jgi:hypothetical protein
MLAPAVGANKHQNTNDNMKIIDQIKQPIALAVLTVLVVCLLLFIFRTQKLPQDAPILSVLRAQRMAAIESVQGRRLLLFPYANRIGRIDASACPDDFFEAWQKYVSDMQTLSATRRANGGNAILHIGAALVFENPGFLSGAMPEHPEEGEILLNTAAADWQNVKHVALRYGIKMTPLKYSDDVKRRNHA